MSDVSRDIEPLSSSQYLLLGVIWKQQNNFVRLDFRMVADFIFAMQEVYRETSEFDFKVLPAFVASYRLHIEIDLLIHLGYLKELRSCVRLTAEGMKRTKELDESVIKHLAEMAGAFNGMTANTLHQVIVLLDIMKHSKKKEDIEKTYSRQVSSTYYSASALSFLKSHGYL